MAQGDFQRLNLAVLRQKAGVTMDEIINSTKISRRFLLAIEEGDYDQLPGGVFNVNYIRQYAQAIGQDAEMILEDHQRHLEKSADWPTAQSEKESPAAEPRWVRFFSMG